MKKVYAALFVAAAVFLLFGLTFLAAPDWATTNFAHTAEGIPLSFGGRYIGLAALLAVFAFLKDLRALSMFCAVGALLAFIDVTIYLFVENTLWNIAQHCFVGVAGVICSKLLWDAHKRNVLPNPDNSST